MAVTHLAISRYDSKMASSERPQVDKYTKTIAVGTVVLVLLTVVGLLASSSKSRPTPSASGNGANGSTSHGKKGPSPPPKLTYLADMSPSEGSTPLTGDFVLGGHHYETSIFYEGVEGYPPNEGPCSGEGLCRAVTYDLAGNYNMFTAAFGITSKEAADAPNGHFWVIAENKVLRQGSFEGEQPIQLSLTLDHAQHLELKAAGTNMGTGDPNIVWGNAHVEP